MYHTLKARRFSRTQISNIILSFSATCVSFGLYLHGVGGIRRKGFDQTVQKHDDKRIGFIFGDGIPSSAQAYLKVCSTMSDPSLNDGKPSSDSAVSSNKQQGALPSSDTTVQKRSVLRTEETKWQANRMSTKQVTITVTQSIRQIDKTGKITEKTHTTFEVMKPGDPLKEGTGSNVLK
ncbi:uncharacterized protein baalcb isoform X2 [Lepisosteus oculatus]|uniref:uncharacterized protein baalcb isoform X2 n=1 Tax=Lepisosteus oculatus TaxID=7918 RepID=UPI0007403944|nr:PREDICTED: uncharacterized protein LOC102698119 isoform X2 [Lepisosteus oculatus]